MDLARKIKTPFELSRILHTRDETVALIHGTFDICHPGHIRHAMYAKSKADTLVASLTADRFVEKRITGVHVPQDLRAQSLAALEFVDYVMIDDHATPLETIALLQPDFYLKGFDYAALDSPATQAEAQAVAAYGGQILFSPGDITYSSSKLIELAPPSLKYEKLLMAMERADLKFNHLRTMLTMFKSFRVHVVGDTIVDSYTQTAMIGGQSKTPTISVLHERVENFVGGAGVVAMHLAAAGAQVNLSTVRGADLLGDLSMIKLHASGVTTHPICDDTRPTTHKNAIVCDGYRLLKIDTLDNRSISDNVLARLCADLREIESDAVVFSDFRHGIFNRRTIPALIEAIRAPYRVADSQVASRWGNILDFQHFDLITPNEREARFAMGDQDSGIQALASHLYEQSNCKTLLLKLGERGLLASRGTAAESFTVLDSFARHVVDAVGSGDAMLAYSTLTMLATGDPVAASILGSIAAALECEQDGNVPITPEMMAQRINELEKECGYG